MHLKHQLPEFYRDFLPKKFLEMNPVEEKATCHACIMAKPKYRGKYPYQPDLKCCTFEPFLPNYLVGAQLELLTKESGQVGAQRLLSKIDKRQYALPIGVVPTPEYQMAFNNRKKGEFGQKKEWLCSYYDQENQNCSIWRHRGVVCTSFYCKSSQGKDGKNFWAEMNNYLSYIEISLAEEALVQLDFSPRQLSEMLEYINIKTPSPKISTEKQMPLKKWKEVWNHYDEDIPKFYQKSLEIVRNLDKRSADQIFGDLGEDLLEKVQSSYVW